MRYITEPFYCLNDASAIKKPTIMIFLITNSQIFFVEFFLPFLQKAKILPLFCHHLKVLFLTIYDSHNTYFLLILSNNNSFYIVRVYFCLLLNGHWSNFNEYLRKYSQKYANLASKEHQIHNNIQVKKFYSILK